MQLLGVLFVSVDIGIKCQGLQLERTVPGPDSPHLPAISLCTTVDGPIFSSAQAAATPPPACAVSLKYDCSDHCAVSTALPESASQTHFPG